jgi:hypothetical protein
MLRVSSGWLWKRSGNLSTFGVPCLWFASRSTVRRPTSKKVLRETEEPEQIFQSNPRSEQKASHTAQESNVFSKKSKFHHFEGNKSKKQDADYERFIQEFERVNQQSNKPDQNPPRDSKSPKPQRYQESNSRANSHSKFNNRKERDFESENSFSKHNSKSKHADPISHYESSSNQWNPQKEFRSDFKKGKGKFFSSDGENFSQSAKFSPSDSKSDKSSAKFSKDFNDPKPQWKSKGDAPVEFKPFRGGKSDFSKSNSNSSFYDRTHRGNHPAAQSVKQKKETSTSDRSQVPKSKQNQSQTSQSHSKIPIPNTKQSKQLPESSEAQEKAAPWNPCPKFQNFSVPLSGNDPFSSLISFVERYHEFKTMIFVNNIDDLNEIAWRVS